MADLVLREDDNALCTLTLNRPEKLNAMNVPMFIELRSHVEELARQFDTIGCLVVKGSGGCFSAGNDLKGIEEGHSPPTPNFQAETVEGLSNLPQPVISAVHGHCYTGALELALAGDIIIAAESARFADTHARWSMTPSWGMSQRLPRRIGASKAKEMLFTGKTYTAEEALAMGLVNMCVPDESFEAEVETLARTILENSWFSHQAYKRLIKNTDGMLLEDGLRYETEHSEGRGPDMKERISAFGKKK